MLAGIIIFIITVIGVWVALAKNKDRDVVETKDYVIRDFYTKG